MQRKSNILRQKRGGFAMIMAIFFMVLMATMMLYMLNASAETTERTSSDYVNEQAQLLAKSTVEYVLLRVSGFNRDTDGDGVVDDCLTGLNLTYPEGSPMYKITVNISYHGLGAGAPAKCTSNGTQAALNTAESVGTMLIDVYVEDHPDLQLNEPVRYHRRTLQKL